LSIPDVWSARAYAGVLAIVLGIVHVHGSHAQSLAEAAYPTKPVRIIVPSSAGGSTDFLIRPLAGKLTDALGKPVIVENRPGAGSVIGTELVVKAAPDGYTLLAAPASITMSPALYKLSFDPVRDLAPIANLSAFPNLLVVHPSLPVRSVRDLIALARAKPREINFGSSGVATGTHMSMELFMSMASIKLVHVPYKGGAPAVTALLSGEVQANFATITTALPHVRTGRLRALAVTTAHRSAAAPEIPTVSESGLKGYAYASWIGLLAPAGTPRAIVARLSTEAVKAVHTPEIREILAAEGSEPLRSTPEEFLATIAAEVKRWTKVVQAAGIRPQ
jgi:tripartite-type tricarboxylate transporter receptor subunit TctC